MANWRTFGIVLIVIGLIALIGGVVCYIQFLTIQDLAETPSGDLWTDFGEILLLTTGGYNFLAITYILMLIGFPCVIVGMLLL